LKVNVSKVIVHLSCQDACDDRILSRSTLGVD
jgi:hypothetical protein